MIDPWQFPPPTRWRRYTSNGVVFRLLPTGLSQAIGVVALCEHGLAFAWTCLRCGRRCSYAER
jgi:hypothetical protein